jgi:hypothetical protein
MADRRSIVRGAVILGVTAVTLGAAAVVLFVIGVSTGRTLSTGCSVFYVRAAAASAAGEQLAEDGFDTQTYRVTKDGLVTLYGEADADFLSILGVRSDPNGPELEEALADLAPRKRLRCTERSYGY